MSANFQSINPRKGLAMASLVVGIISIPTFGLLAVGGITGIILGAVALSKIKNDPEVYGGKGLAIAGIVTSAVSLILFSLSIVAAIALPRLQQSLMRGRETAAVKSLLTIHQNQIHYKSLKGHYATLQELGEAGLIDNTYLNSAIVGSYTYDDSDISEQTYCVHADRASNIAAARDFIICEDGIVRYLESKAKGTVKRGEGQRLNGGDSAAPEAIPTAKP